MRARLLRWALLGLAIPAAAPAQKPVAPPPPAALVAAARAGKPLWATLETSLGKIVVELDAKSAPASAALFVGLATGEVPWHLGNQPPLARPLYEGTTFHRVVPGFGIQGGDPSGSGTGLVGVAIDSEAATPAQKALHFKRGAVGLAGVPGTQQTGNQFFVLVGDAPWLDGRYTQVGHVVSGLEVADKISEAPRGPGDRPLEPVILKSVRISDRPPGKSR